MTITGTLAAVVLAFTWGVTIPPITLPFGFPFSLAACMVIGSIVYGSWHGFRFLRSWYRQLEREMQLRRRAERVRSIADLEVMDPFSFAYAVTYVLSEAWHCSCSGSGTHSNGTIEVLFRKNNRVILVHIHRCGTHAGIDDVVLRQFVSTYYMRAHEGVFVTLGAYSDAALAYARTQSRLRLIDGSAFVRMAELIRANNGIDVADQRSPYMSEHSDTLDGSQTGRV